MATRYASQMRLGRWLPLIGLLIGLQPVGAGQGKFPCDVRDDLGREVCLRARPRRIIALAASLTEIVFALGTGGELVGVDTPSDYPPAARKIPKVGDFMNPNPERIVALRPDLILLSSATIDTKSVEDLAVLVHAPIFVQKPRSLQEVLSSFRRIGRLLGAERRAAQLVGKMEQAMVWVQRRVQGKARPAVFIEVCRDPLITVGGHNWIDDLVTLAGGVNVAGKAASPFPVYTLESLIAARPDIYLCGGVGNVSVQARIARRSDYRALRAVREGHVHRVDTDLIFRPGPRLREGLLMLARLLHPEVFRSPQGIIPARRGR